MNDNRLKTINGIRCKTKLVDVVKALQSKGTITCCLTNYRCGYSQKANDQFFAPFCLELRNGAKMLLYSTNTIRNDRMCIQQWNADHIKRIDNSVEKAIIVVPSEIVENERENKEVVRYREKIQSGEYYSAIDDVVLQDDLMDYILGKKDLLE